MIYSYNESPFRWIVLPLLWLPMLLVNDAYGTMLVAPAVLLGTTLLWIVPTKVIIVAPQHIDDAIAEIPSFFTGDEFQMALYHKSVEEYAKHLTKTDDIEIDGD